MIVALLTLGEVVVFALYPQPDTIAGWFELFQDRPIIGLLDFWGMELLMYAMFALVFLALFLVLSKLSRSETTIALTLAMLGIATFFATTNPFSMLSLSRQFAAATTDAESSALLAAGEALLTNTGQRSIGGFNLSLFLVSVAGLMFVLVMRRSAAFHGTIVNAGIIAFGLSLADYLRQVLTSSDVIALLVIIPGALATVVWFTLVGRQLLRLGGQGG